MNLETGKRPPSEDRGLQTTVIPSGFYWVRGGTDGTWVELETDAQALQGFFTDALMTLKANHSSD